MGTPHCGSGLAEWAVIGSKFLQYFRRVNQQTLEVLQRQSEVMARIRQDFHTMLRGWGQSQEGEIAIICFYEELPVSTIGEIVPKASATLDRYTSVGIHANHMDMTKFLSDQDPDYQNVLSELQRFIALRLASSESSGTGGESHCEVRNQGYSAGEQVKTTVHNKAIPNQPTRSINTFSGNFNTGGGKMIQGGHALTEGRFDGTFSSHGGPQFLASSFNTNGAPIYIDSSSDNRPPTSVCELPSFLLSPYFTGRRDELQQIDRVFNTSSGNLPPRCIIHGMPGIGKTQLALQFATLAFQRGQYPYVFWVSAVSVEKLTRDFSKLVDLVRLPGRHTLDQASKLTMARAWLEDSTAARSWLVVLDNVSEETAVILRDILPRGDCGGRLLITTRTARIADVFNASGALSQLALQPPGIGDAVAMLSAGVNLEREGKEEVSYTDAKRLVQLVGKLPLAIDQAASYMRETGSGLQEVLDIYKSDEAPEIFSWENDLSRHEEKSVVAIFTPALNKIQQTVPDAMTLLRILCFCDPEGIPISIFQQGCDALYQEDRSRLSKAREVDKLEAVRGLRHSLKRVRIALRQKSRHDTVNVQGNDKLKAVQDLFRSPLRLSKAIQEVQRLSLAAQALEGSDRVIRIHDLVHLLLRSKLMADTERRQWLGIVICIVCKAFEAIGDRRSPQNWSRCGRFISHIKSLEGFAEQQGLRDSELLDASTWAAVYLNECGLYEKAVILNKRILEQKTCILGGQHPSTLTSMNNLALVLGSQGKYEEAEGIHRQTLALMESVLGKKHPSTLMSMNNLAGVLDRQGKYEEAEGIHRQTLALSESVLGKKHPSTLTSMNNLAGVLDCQGKYEEAEGIHRQTLALSESVLGKKHPSTLTSMNNLAGVLDSQGKYEEAEGIHRQELALSESVLGKKHPDTLGSMNNLAGVLESQGKYEEAEGIHRQTLALSESVLGKKHPSTLTSMNNLAWVLDRQGKYEEAEGIHRQTLALSESVLGKKHPSTLTSMNNLALVLGSQGKYEEAEGIHRQTLALMESVLGKKHPSTLMSMNNLAGVLDRQGKYEEAEGIHRQTLALRESVLGKKHPDTLMSMNNLAWVLDRQGKYEEAEGIHRQTLALSESVLGKEHPSTLTSIYCLAYLLHQRKEYKDAGMFYHRAYAGYRRTLGENHPTTAACSRHYSSMLKEEDG
ncbi:hypothetical protein OEA41_009869 [Lepraria neglecta]|uniref:NB-ARC domain-containing protein n=1 Tax=Lepraria neglecta TaxID=209136 RepID=A0AAD9YVI0_9LECA|nr:hypothetical protein OEA41_009869 [Lepraria neglecta]